MQFNDRAEIKGFRATADGYLVGEVLCARTGCQDYYAGEMGLDGDPARVVTVYRPEDAVFSKDSLATYAGKPVTLGHPSEAVTADNWKEHAGGVIGGEVARDGEFVRVPIALMDAALIAAVKDGAREVSMGYTTPVEMRDGVAPDGTKYQAVQTGPIRINHLAAVPRARGGDKLRIGDGAGPLNWGAGPITVSDKGGQMADLRKIIVDGLQVETTEAGATAIEKLTKALAAAGLKLVEVEAAMAEDKAKLEAELAAKDAALEKLTKAQLTDADLDARVAARADLVAKATMIAKDLKPAGLSDADIRKAAVVSVLGDAAIAGKTAAYIDARFDILAEDAAKADPIKGAKSAAVLTGDAGLDAAYAARDAQLANAWKGAN